MAHPTRPPARHSPNPCLALAFRPPPAPAPAPPQSPTTPAARRPDTPQRAAQQDTPFATSVDGSRNSARSQCKQDTRYTQILHANEATSRTKRIAEPDSSDKLKTPRLTGGTYSKPDARVKLIPAEDITYVQHRKPYGRTVGSAGLQKKHCRRSVTPPPNSRKVSVLGPTSLTQSPRSPGIASLKNPASPSCKSSQPLSTNLYTDATPRNLDRMDSTKALAQSSSSSILHSQGQCNKKLSASLPKGAMINPLSPSLKQSRAPNPSEDPLCTKAEPSSKSLCAPESGKLCSTNINLTTMTTAPGLQAPIVEPLLSPTSVLSERPTETCPDTRTAAPVAQEPSVKPVFQSPIPLHNESSMECNNIPPINSPQSIASAEHGALLQESNSGASINCITSSVFCHNVAIRETGAPVILHTKLHKKHYQPETSWKVSFHVTAQLIHTCDGLEAHLPFHINVRVYEASRHMPEILNLEAVPLYQLWPKKFKIVPPDGEDIGLLFVSSHQRPHSAFNHLLEKVASHTGLLTKIGDTELAIFSSKLLSPDYQKKNGQLYFWGIFGKRLRKNRRKPNRHVKKVMISNPSQPNEDTCNKYEKVSLNMDVAKGKETGNTESDIGMTLDTRGNPTDVTGNKEVGRDNYEGIAKVLDLTGGKETDRVNDCIAVLGTPDSNPSSGCSAPAASLLNGCRSLDSANKSLFSFEDSACQPADRSSASSDLMLNIPPGFSIDVPPGFTKAHYIPPGFTEAHRRLPAAISSAGSETFASTTGAEKKPIFLKIEKKSLSYADAPPRLILDAPPGFHTDIPPGFTEAHRRLPAAISSAGSETFASTTGAEKKPLSYADAPPSLILDAPPGFRTDIPPGFTEAHRRLPAAISSAGSETFVSTTGAEKKPLSYADAPPSLILDAPPRFRTDIPPGFTEAHCRLPAAISSAGTETFASTSGTENKPLIRFSPNVLPAIDKATENRILYSLASGASSRGKAGKADEMEFMHNEVKVEQDENSEEREFPKIRRLSDLYPSSSDITEFSQPTHLPDKFQEWTPGKQMHERERGRQESPDPSPADTMTRRPNVNGQIALNNSADQKGMVR
ncbi:uncharacterized protein LOC120646873 isoform X3 [Panicum virgatum]|nr:uncharacterized protein LOC120646873 isoform X3 [Panicum virgatum]